MVDMAAVDKAEALLEKAKPVENFGEGQWSGKDVDRAAPGEVSDALRAGALRQEGVGTGDRGHGKAPASQWKGSGFTKGDDNLALARKQRRQAIRAQACGQLPGDVA